MKALTQKLNIIQTKLNAPKDSFNAFGKYKYRSAESILQAIKPLLVETGLVLTISDCLEHMEGRVYIKAVATVSDGENSISVSALAREPENKKGADESQVTGAASSYARKYALCGLFAIDDNKDADATNTHGQQQNAGEDLPESEKPEPVDYDAKLSYFTDEMRQSETLEHLQQKFKEAWLFFKNKPGYQEKVKDIYDYKKVDIELTQHKQHEHE